MYAARDRTIKSVLIFVSFFWHFLILYALFVLTRRPSDEPLRITINPKTVEFLLSHPKPAAQVPPQALVPTIVAPPVQAPQIVASPQPVPVQQVPELGEERYELKNPVSGGSLSSGSIVAGQPESQSKEQPEEQQEPQAVLSAQVTPQVQLQEESKVAADNEPSERGAQDASQGEDGDQATVLEKIEAYGSTSIRGVPQEGAPSRPQKIASQEPETPARREESQVMHAKPIAVKGLTLADITRGFVKKVRHEQATTSRYDYQGGGRGQGVYAPPTSGVAMAEQIYASKIYALLEQSAMAYNRKIYARQELDMETTIEVSIDKSGRIIDVALTPPLAEKDMELALSTIVKGVGLFPPIPKQFKKQKIVVSIPIHIRSQQGFASYRLLYGMRTL